MGLRPRFALLCVALIVLGGLIGAAIHEWVMSRVGVRWDFLVTSGPFLVVFLLPMWMALSRWVLRPLARLDQANRLTSQGAGNASFIPEAEIPDDEIGDVMRNRNQMLRTLLERASQLHTAEEVYRRILGTTLDGFWIMDTQGKLLDVNDSYCQMSGYTRDELLRMDINDIDPDESPEEVGRSMAQIMEAGHGRFEVRHRRKDGAILDVEISTNYVAAEGRFVNFLRDVTERNRSERALRDSEQRLRGLIRHAPEGICLLDGSYRLLMANPAAEEYLEYLAGVGLGDTLSHLGNREIAQVTSSHPGSGGRDAEGVTHEGRLFRISAGAVGEGQPSGGWVLVIREVTEEHRAQERLQQQSRLAAVGQLAAGIAHDFNNVLTPIMGYAEIMALEEGISASAKQHLRTISQQAARAAQLIRRILDFSRAADVDMRSLPLAPVVTESVELLRRTLPESIRLSVEVEGDGCTVRGNLAQLQQVLTNLALNARDAMPDGGELELTIACRRFGSAEARPSPDITPGEWAIIAVTDTGTGMSPEVMDHIFEPFFTTKPRGEGTGLGLAQAYGIAKQHGGDIQLTSDLGKGTTVTIYLPTVPTAAAMDDGPPPRVRKGKGEAILVVEDEPEVLVVVKAILEALNYRVLTARNGREALLVHEANRDTAAVFTDLVMPEMGGVALYRELLRHDPDVKVAFMTGYATAVDRAALPDRAMLLDKPLTVEKVGSALARMLHVDG